MTRHDPADVVLVRFPFTDLATTKRRPAVIVSRQEYAARFGDVVLLALTSRPQSDPDAIGVQHWKAAGLLQPTWFKPLLATVSGSLITQRLGQLDPDDRIRVRQVIHSIVAPEFRA